MRDPASHLSLRTADPLYWHRETLEPGIPINEKLLAYVISTMQNELAPALQRQTTAIFLFYSMRSGARTTFLGTFITLFPWLRCILDGLCHRIAFRSPRPSPGGI